MKTESPISATAALLNWRRQLPAPLRLYYRLTLSHFTDLRTGIRSKLARPSRLVPAFAHGLVLSQPVIANEWRENKLHNFRLATHQINAVTIRPGEVFSFWKTLGKPTTAKGYKAGRNLVYGQVQATVGGGLCQVSGILYHLSLLAGLSVLERHNHSVDLYANGEPRFTPLGADATVAYGYKDLRVANPYQFPIRFELEVLAETLVCHLRSEQPIAQHEIAFQSTATSGGVRVVATSLLPDGGLAEVAQSYYRIHH
ncbi:MAG: VanW family protein [Saprospiraceae bacterium]|nr:VanW family protein [Saprospiraceae bacterium]